MGQDGKEFIVVAARCMEYASRMERAEEAARVILGYWARAADRHKDEAFLDDTVRACLSHFKAAVTLDYADRPLSPSSSALDFVEV